MGLTSDNFISELSTFFKDPVKIQSIQSKFSQLFYDIDIKSIFNEYNDRISKISSRDLTGSYIKALASKFIILKYIMSSLLNLFRYTSNSLQLIDGYSTSIEEVYRLLTPNSDEIETELKKLKLLNTVPSMRSILLQAVTRKRSIKFTHDFFREHSALIDHLKKDTISLAQQSRQIYIESFKFKQDSYESFLKQGVSKRRPAVRHEYGSDDDFSDDDLDINFPRKDQLPSTDYKSAIMTTRNEKTKQLIEKIENQLKVLDQKNKIVNLPQSYIEQMNAFVANFSKWEPLLELSLDQSIGEITVMDVVDALMFMYPHLTADNQNTLKRIFATIVLTKPQSKPPVKKRIKSSDSSYVLGIDWNNYSFKIEKFIPDQSKAMDTGEISGRRNLFDFMHGKRQSPSLDQKQVFPKKPTTESELAYYCKEYGEQEPHSFQQFISTLTGQNQVVPTKQLDAIKSYIWAFVRQMGLFFKDETIINFSKEDWFKQPPDQQKAHLLRLLIQRNSSAQGVSMEEASKTTNMPDTESLRSFADISAAFYQSLPLDSFKSSFSKYVHLLSNSKQRNKELSDAFVVDEAMLEKFSLGSSGRFPMPKKTLAQQFLKTIDEEADPFYVAIKSTQ